MSNLIGYIFIALVGIGGLLAVYLPFHIVLKLAYGDRISFLRQTVRVSFVAITLVILSATIFMGFDIYTLQHHVNLNPLQYLRESHNIYSERVILQLISNVVMFIPVGCLFPLVCEKRASFWQTAVYSFAFSFSIEFVQYFTGRVSDIDDLLMNFAGGIIGFILFKILESLFGRKKWWKEAAGMVPSVKKYNLEVIKL